MNIFDKLSQKFNSKKSKAFSQTGSPIKANWESEENEFLARMSKHALKLYEKQCDIKNFTKLALSNPENTEHNQLVEKLLQEDVLDPLGDEAVKALSSNPDLLRDLGL